MYLSVLIANRRKWVSKMSVRKFDEVDRAVCYNCGKETKCRNDGIGFLCTECWGNLYDEDEIIVLQNKRVFEYGFREGKWVWNETQKEYQCLRYCYISKLKEYHWCDGWGNVIEDDELWLYEVKES